MVDDSSPSDSAVDMSACHRPGALGPVLLSRLRRFSVPKMSLHDGKHGPSEMPQWQLRRLILPMMISGNMVDWVDGSETWRRV